MFQVVDDERFPENSYVSHVNVLMSGTFFTHFKRLPDFFFAHHTHTMRLFVSRASLKRY